MRKSNYSTLNSTYKAYKESNNLEQSPSGWWAIIGSNNLNKATVINPGEPSLEPSVTCNNFSDTWSDKVGATNTKIPYYYSNTATGNLNCTTTKDPDTNVHTATITCDGKECCPYTGINGLIPAGTSFSSGQVRKETDKAQCVGNVPKPPEYDCGKHGTWITNIDYEGGGICLCDGGWKNDKKDRISPCNTMVKCSHPNCGKGCNKSGNCGGFSNFCNDSKCKNCCSGYNTGCGFLQQPQCQDKNSMAYNPSNGYPCWCDSLKKGENSQLIIQSSTPTSSTERLKPICNSALGDKCMDCANLNPSNPHCPSKGNLWTKDGQLQKISKYVGCDGNLDNGYSCEGGPCRNPGSKDKNGMGCGWKIE